MNKKLENHISCLTKYTSRKIVEKIFQKENILINQYLVSKFIYPECTAICSIIYNIENLEIVYINNDSKIHNFKNDNFLKTLYTQEFLIKVSNIIGKNYKLIKNNNINHENVIYEEKFFSRSLSLIAKKVLLLLFIKIPIFIALIKSKFSFKKSKSIRNLNFSSNDEYDLDINLKKVLNESKLINFFSKKIVHLHENFSLENQIKNIQIYGESIQFNYTKRYEFIFKSNYNIVYQHGGLRGIVKYRRLNLEYFSNIYLSFYNEKVFNNKSEEINKEIKIIGKSPIIKIDKICHKIEYFFSKKNTFSPNLVFYLSNHDLNKSYVDYGIVLNPKNTFEHNKLIDEMIYFSNKNNIDISIRSRPGRYKNNLLKELSYYESNLVSNKMTISIIDHPGRILIERLELRCPLLFWGNPEDYDLTYLGRQLFKKLDELNLILRNLNDLKRFMKDFHLNKKSYLNIEIYSELFKWYDSECSGGDLLGLFHLI